MILADATMAELTNRRNELMRQVDAINREIARRFREQERVQNAERKAEVERQADELRFRSLADFIANR